MTALVDRLRAAIEERLALAEAASGDTWRALRMTDVGYFVGDENGRAVARLWVEMDELADGPQPVGGNPLDTSKHIAANDPSAVIARCKVDLAILAIHRRVDDDPDHGVIEPACYGCAFNAIEEYLVPDAKDCPMVRLLAEGYGITEEQT